MTLPLKASFDPLSATDYDDLVRLAKPLRAFKEVDEGPYASTTFQDDDYLKVTPDVNTRYDVQLWLLANATTAADINLKWTGHTSAGGWWTVKNRTTSGAADTVFQNTAGWGSSLSLEGDASDKLYEIFGVIETTATPNVLQLQWAPLVAGNVTVKKFSTLVLRKH